MSRAVTTFDVYNDEAHGLVEKYESRRFEDIHAGVIDWLPVAPARVLDIGAGSGRDAAWFADHGYQVTAVEPAQQMRKLAESLHSQSTIMWMEDSLPGLSAVLARNNRYDLIWLSAVWIHVPPASRSQTFQTLVSLLRPAGRMMLSLRQGPFPENRIMYATPLDEVESLADEHGLVALHIANTNDKLDRAGVSWRSVVLGGRN